MYIPAHFEPPDDAAVRALLTEHGAADLVTVTDRGRPRLARYGRVLIQVEGAE